MKLTKEQFEEQKKETKALVECELDPNYLGNFMIWLESLRSHKLVKKSRTKLGDMSLKQLKQLDSKEEEAE